MGRRGVGEEIMLVIGISALYHDSAAALIADGRVLRAAQEERFSRVKHDRSFPVKALEYCIEDVAVSEAKRIDAVVYYDNPLMTCDRFIHNCLWIGDKGEELIRKDYARVFGQRMWVQKTICPMRLERISHLVTMMRPFWWWMALGNGRPRRSPWEKATESPYSNISTILILWACSTVQSRISADSESILASTSSWASRPTENRATPASSARS